MKTAILAPKQAEMMKYFTSNHYNDKSSYSLHELKVAKDNALITISSWDGFEWTSYRLFEIVDFIESIDEIINNINFLNRKTMRTSMFIPRTVVYKNQYYFAFQKRNDNTVRLLRPDGTIYEGCPRTDKLSNAKINGKVRLYPTYQFNGHRYTLTKLGLVSLTTGKVCSQSFQENVVNNGKRVKYFN